MPRPETFALGGSSTGEPIERPVAPEGPPRARFVVRLGPSFGWISPAGLDRGGRGLGGPVQGERWAVGTVVAHDDERAEAWMVASDAGWGAAQEVLRRWAALDRWTLVAVHRSERGVPAVLRTGWQTWRCCSCRAETHLSAVAMSFSGVAAFHPTRCGDCRRGRKFPVADDAG